MTVIRNLEKTKKGKPQDLPKEVRLKIGWKNIKNQMEKYTTHFDTCYKHIRFQNHFYNFNIRFYILFLLPIFNIQHKNHYQLLVISKKMHKIHMQKLTILYNNTLPQIAKIIKKNHRFSHKKQQNNSATF
eukprot:TRINITY_DN76859_c0_g1_i1.p3 TRINITY_DN76859_c0_g1~~TRINITY_DN76859_c0_g1_i1.p3  ORF type:complete len:145 (+),score=2.70 TRINITY_DN76859_c0_g1_i1:46-435(+)